MIHFDLICNEFEYEIAYKKTFPEIINESSFNSLHEPLDLGLQTRHKRGMSQGTVSSGFGGLNDYLYYGASPPSHLNAFGNPHQDLA